jgi:hypothetical protein
MSTEHEQYSIANQSAAMEEYANAHSMEIVRTYVDRGKSGLRIAGRDGLKNLLQTVESRAADFNVVLVYDVSRWGRFQDVDETRTLSRCSRLCFAATSEHNPNETLPLNAGPATRGLVRPPTGSEGVGHVAMLADLNPARSNENFFNLVSGVTCTRRFRFCNCPTTIPGATRTPVWRKRELIRILLRPMDKPIRASLGIAIVAVVRC